MSHNLFKDRGHNYFIPKSMKIGPLRATISELLRESQLNAEGGTITSSLYHQNKKISANGKDYDVLLISLLGEVHIYVTEI